MPPPSAMGTVRQGAPCSAGRLLGSQGSSVNPRQAVRVGQGLPDSGAPLPPRPRQSPWYGSVDRRSSALICYSQYTTPRLFQPGILLAVVGYYRRGLVV